MDRVKLIKKCATRALMQEEGDNTISSPISRINELEEDLDQISLAIFHHHNYGHQAEEYQEACCA